jgi:LPXTG-motif cell wall-anchored protein
MRPVPLAPTGDATDAHTALMLALLGTLALLASRRKRLEQ